MNSEHDAERLLESMSADWPVDSSIVAGVMQAIESKSASSGLFPKLQSMTVTQRVAVGSLGLLATILLVLAVFVITSFERATAVERMVEKLREVTSFQFTFNEKSTLTREGAEKPVTVEVTSTLWWNAKNAIREELFIIEYDPNSLPGEREIKQLSHVEVVIPSGKRGVVVDHTTKNILWVPEFSGDWDDSSPVTRLRMVREKSGEIVRELGSKKISGKQANGFVMKLHGVEEGSGYDALEVWIDSKTDLPIEFSYELQKETWSELFRIYDCRWNIDFDPQLFEPTPPKGYTDTTPPRNDEGIEQILQALRLYAELSGGRYPRDSQFDIESIRKEMLKLAGFAGPVQQEWLNDAKFQQIEKAQPSFEWLSRIVLKEHLAGYMGKTVTSDQKDKILLWWLVSDDHYRVFYGDLSTELMHEDDWEIVRINLGAD